MDIVIGAFLGIFTPLVIGGGIYVVFQILGLLKWFFSKVTSAFSKRKPLAPPATPEKLREDSGGVSSYEKWKASLKEYYEGRISLDDFVAAWSGWTILEKEKTATPAWRNPLEPYYGCATSVGFYNTDGSGVAISAGGVYGASCGSMIITNGRSWTYDSFGSPILVIRKDEA